MTAPPSTARDMYVIGRTGSFACPTVSACDVWLTTLSQARGSADPKMRERLADDIDRVLERRLRLVVA